MRQIKSKSVFDLRRKQEKCAGFRQLLLTVFRQKKSERDPQTVSVLRVRSWVLTILNQILFSINLITNRGPYLSE